MGWGFPLTSIVVLWYCLITWNVPVSFFHHVLSPRDDSVDAYFQVTTIATDSPGILVFMVENRDTGRDREKGEE